MLYSRNDLLLTKFYYRQVFYNPQIYYRQTFYYLKMFCLELFYYVSVFLIFCIVNREKWLRNLSKFFVVCFCWLFWELALHKTGQNTIKAVTCSHTTNHYKHGECVISASSVSKQRKISRLKDRPT